MVPGRKDLARSMAAHPGREAGDTMDILAGKEAGPKTPTAGARKLLRLGVFFAPVGTQFHGRAAAWIAAAGEVEIR